MWVPKSFVSLFATSHEELAKTKAERDTYRDELAKSQILNDWLRMQVNTLQMERTALLDKVYGIKIPAPQLEKAYPPRENDPFSIENVDFEDIGDTMAKKLGLPVYGN